MNWLLLCRMLGLLGILVGAAMVFSLPWAFPFAGQTLEVETDGLRGLAGSITISLAVGGALFFVGRRERGTILRREALAIVGLGWLLAGLLGALPFVLSGVERRAGDAVVRMTVADAIFESISGFTTTGASVLTDLDAPPVSPDDPGVPGVTQKLVPRCVLFWRSFTHWLGGMGIIVLFVAVLGQLGAGGKALMRREVPGPISETVRPRVRETAIVMWAIYMGLTVILTIILLLEGMTFFDALCHTFGTLATGGFSTHNASLGHFKSPLIEWTVIVFMIMAGTNFNLYYLVLISRKSDVQKSQSVVKRWKSRLKPLLRDPEYRVYLGLLLAAATMLSLSLWRNGRYETVSETIRHAAFTTVSLVTTTGFGTEDFDQWTSFCRTLIFILLFVGGCAGSTGGGIKVVRCLLFVRILKLELESAFRPNVVRPLRIAGVNLDNTLRHEVIVYFSLMLFLFITSTLLLVAIEPGEPWRSAEEQLTNQAINVDLLECASAAATTLNNVGPGLGAVGPAKNFALFSSQSKLVMSLLMLLGRLELFAILVLFVPSFWKTQ